jgi:polar amino acid transport system substrate-binding protein
MIGSLVLVSLLTTSLIARITVSRVEGAVVTRVTDLAGKRLAAVSASSGAEYLDTQRLAHQKFGNLAEALNALSTGKTDAVVNSVGTLQYLVKTALPRRLHRRAGYWLPPIWPSRCRRTGLKRPLDQALTAVIASPEWRSVEESYFGQVEESYFGQ